MKEGLLAELQVSRQFFLNTISCFEEQDSGFVPKDGMYSVAQQVMHTAQVVDWFMEGTFDEKGFDMNFGDFEARIRKCTSLQEALDALNVSYDRAEQTVKDKPESVWMETFPKDAAIMPGLPKVAIISSIADHTAHHRGSLAVYARLMDKVPPMPYGEG